MKSRMDVKKSAVKPTNNYMAATDKKSTVAPSRRGFQPKSSTQLEAKSQFSGYKGYEAGKTGTPKHCDLVKENGLMPTYTKAPRITTDNASMASYGVRAPKSTGQKSAPPKAGNTSNPGNKY